MRTRTGDPAAPAPETRRRPWRRPRVERRLRLGRGPRLGRRLRLGRGCGRAVLLLLLLLVGVLIGADRPTLPIPGPRGPGAISAGARPGTDPGAAVTPAPAAPGSAAGDHLPAPSTGSGAFAYAASAGPVLGTAGEVRAFHVAVEREAGQRPEDFAGAVDAILGDPRSWVAGGDVRFQRVPADSPASFEVYLATAGTSELMCADGGLSTERFTSCRLPGRVIINLSRWLGAVPGYGAPLAVYRAYALNHEVGHELGLGHETCPAPGAPAPVMQQQTYGLLGCVANAWPYLDGRRYAGDEVAWG
ncbi:DUF3152 domain-containing protein [Plantactinospora siamensis]|uniref:DUF3152 domain-containing protein n=1 Tax=Plantactinospora siamensis TaxID=555372 RepID=A0ABV6NYQ3_9ACTN